MVLKSKMIKPSVSIIIPVLNGQKTIKRCLDSIDAQETPRKWEVIVVDNGSTDATLAILRKYSVTVLNESKKGAGAARNKGLEYATGEFVAFIDADVELAKDWVEKSCLVLENSIFAGTQGPIKPSSLRIGKDIGFLDNFRLRYGEYSTFGLFNHAETKYKNPLINTAACMYLKKWVTRVNGFDSDLMRCEDTDLTNKILAAGGHFSSNSNAIANVYWDRSLIQYLARFYKIGYFHTGLNLLWNEPVRLRFRFDLDGGWRKFGFKQVFIFLAVRLLQYLGSWSAKLFFKKEMFELKSSYFRSAKENLLIFDFIDTSGKSWILAPWVRILENNFGYTFIDLKLKKHYLAEPEISRLIKLCIQSQNLSDAEKINVLHFLIFHNLVI
jgi:glycosyltransferase involved in cell wall biosynthesis